MLLCLHVKRKEAAAGQELWLPRWHTSLERPLGHVPLVAEKGCSAALQQWRGQDTAAHALGNPGHLLTEGTRPDQVPPTLTGASCVRTTELTDNQAQCLTTTGAQ